ncbi:MAG: Beta-carotene hydroxylase [Labilithrix sp.]|nr:Beta-carotene hydroxylase [Labilithrix sp.]
MAALCVSAWLNAVIVHNVMHAPLWRSRRLNALTQLVLSLTYGFPVSEYVPGHNLSHHRYTQTTRDVMRTTKVRYRLNALNLLLFFLHIGPRVTATNATFTRHMRRAKPRWFFQLALEIAFAWGAKLVLLAIDWRRALCLVLVPALYAVWGITTVNYLQHDGCDASHPYNHSRNFVGRAFNWLTFNNGFHGAHHHTPGLHWSLLPAAHERLFAGRIDPRLEQRSLAIYLFRAFVFPGIRRRFDGKPVELPADDHDEPWISPRSGGAGGAHATADASVT